MTVWFGSWSPRQSPVDRSATRTWCLSLLSTPRLAVKALRRTHVPPCLPGAFAERVYSRLPVGWEGDVFPMTSQVEYVAIPEPAEKGNFPTCRVSVAPER